MATERDVSIHVKAVTDNFKSGMASVRSELNSLKRSVTGIVGAFALVEMVKKVVALDDSVRRLRVDASLTTAEMLKFKNQAMSVSMSSGVATMDIVKMSQAAFKTGKDMKFVSDEMAFMAKVALATGAPIEQVGAGLGDLYEKTGISGKEFETMVKQLYAFGKTTGRESTFADILPNMGELLKQFKASNPKGSMKEFTTYLMTTMFVDSPTALANTYKKFISPAVKEKLRKNLRMDVGKAFSIQDVVAAAMKVSGGNRVQAIGFLADAFGKTTSEVAKLVDETDLFNASVAKAQGNTRALENDAKIMGGSFSATMTRMKNKLLEFAESKLSKPLAEFETVLNNIVASGNLSAILKDFRDIGLAIAGAYATWKLFQLGKGIVGAFTRKGGGGLGGAMGATPVFVVNMPGGGIPGMPGGKPGGGLGGAGKVGVGAAMGYIWPIAVGAGLGVGLGYGIEKLKERLDNPTAKIEGGLSRPFENVGGAMAPSSIPGIKKIEVNNETHIHMPDGTEARPKSTTSKTQMNQVP